MLWGERMPGAYQPVHRVAATSLPASSVSSHHLTREKNKLPLRPRPAEWALLQRLGYFVWLVLVFMRACVGV